MIDLIEIIEDLLTDFDEMGFVPTTSVPDPVAYAIKWKNKLTNALQELIKQSEWISVDEKLPDNVGKYLVCTAKGKVYVENFVDYYGNGKRLCFCNYIVTHWMPLPEPPKGE